MDHLVSLSTPHQWFMECLSNLIRSHMLSFFMDSWLDGFLKKLLISTFTGTGTGDLVVLDASYLQVECSIQSRYGRTKTLKCMIKFIFAALYFSESDHKFGYLLGGCAWNSNFKQI